MNDYYLSIKILCFYTPRSMADFFEYYNISSLADKSGNLKKTEGRIHYSLRFKMATIHML